MQVLCSPQPLANAHPSSLPDSVPVFSKCRALCAPTQGRHVSAGLYFLILILACKVRGHIVNNTHSRAHNPVLSPPPPNLCVPVQLSDARSQREELMAELASLTNQVAGLQAEIDSRDEKMNGLEAAAEQANKGERDTAEHLLGTAAAAAMAAVSFFALWVFLDWSTHSGAGKERNIPHSRPVCKEHIPNGWQQMAVTAGCYCCCCCQCTRANTWSRPLFFPHPLSPPPPQGLSQRWVVCVSWSVSSSSWRCA